MHDDAVYAGTDGTDKFQKKAISGPMCQDKKTETTCSCKM